MTFHDVANAAEFSAWLAHKPYEYLRSESWPSGVPFPWQEDLPWEGPSAGSLARIPDSAWGGLRGPEAHVWLGVLNNADLEKVRQHFGAIPWKWPNAVQLFMRDEGEDYFRVWMLRRGQVEQYVTAKPDEQDRDYWPGWWLELHGNI